MPPSCMNTRISLSSDRISYTEISPDANPIPTTSMAGDWTMHVIAGWEVEEADPLKRFDAEYLWIHVLGEIRIETSKKQDDTNWVRMFQSCIDP